MRHATIGSASGVWWALVGTAALIVAASVSACGSGGGSGGGAGGDRAAAGSAAGDRSIQVPLEDPFLDAYARTFRFRLGQPTGIRLTPDGGSVLFLRSGPRSFVQDLYEQEVESGRERVLLTAEGLLGGKEERLSAEEQARRERARLASRGIASFDLSQDGKTVLVPLSGRLFVHRRDTGVTRELTGDGGFAIDPRLSPDGRSVACVREGDLYVIDVSSGAQTRLTTRENAEIEHGAAEFVAQEEMDRREGYWWSPDSRGLIYQRTDTAGMERFHIADPMDPGKAPKAWAYPRAGRGNAQVTLGLIQASGGATAWIQWDRSAYPYVARVAWAPGTRPTILVQNREQTEQALLSVDPQTGATAPLLVERDAAWVNIMGGPTWIERGAGFLWLSDASGDERLELRRPDGGMVQRLSPSWMRVREVVAADPQGGRVIVTATGEDPALVAQAASGDKGALAPALQTHVYELTIPAMANAPVRVLSDGSALGGGVRRLSDPGVNAATASADARTLVITSDRWDARVRWEVRRLGAEWAKAGEVRSRAEAPAHRANLEFTSARGGSSGLEFHAAIFRPRSFRAGVKYPVILSVYGGPGLQYVSASPRHALLDQWFAERGFIVVRIDGRGTPGRGRDWERAIKGDIIDVAMRDQLEALAALEKRYPEMDSARVGVYGWSFGGYFSALAAMRHPEVFKAGCAGAPVCDWLDYDTHYTERYLGLPAENPGAYERASVLSSCADLRTPLLIIHGTADDNVYFLHSLRMTDALFRAGKVYEFLALPGFTHVVPDPEVTRALYGRVAEFFERELGGPRP